MTLSAFFLGEYGAFAHIRREMLQVGLLTVHVPGFQ